jgi:hypothetical protein
MDYEGIMDIIMKTLCVLGISNQHNIHNLKNRQNCTSAAAGESTGRPERPSLPEPLLQRRLEKERTEKEKAIKEKEIMQKKMDEMQAQLDLAHSKVGEVVSVESPITPSAGKVRLKLI